MKTETSKIIIVVLRQPRRNSAEMRSDPFWEFGSFGCTNCHHTNLMHPQNADEIVGKRFVFAQGGHKGFKLVHLTPPIKIKNRKGFIEAKWSPPSMPFKYLSAPLLINNRGDTDVPSLKKEIKRINRTTWLGKFSSAFRSRKRPVSEAIANELISVYDKRRDNKKDIIATSYEEALPCNPNHIDKNRKATYQSFFKKQTKKCYRR